MNPALRSSATKEAEGLVRSYSGPGDSLGCFQYEDLEQMHVDIYDRLSSSMKSLMKMTIFAVHLEIPKAREHAQSQAGDRSLCCDFFTTYGSCQQWEQRKYVISVVGVPSK